MRSFTHSIALALSLSLLVGCGDPAPACEPACRDGFVCLEGACVSACNPVCGVGERCTADARCVPDDAPDSSVTSIDSGAASTDAGGVSDASVEPGEDAGVEADATSAGEDSAIAADTGTADASAADAGPSSCAAGMVWCGGVCRAPSLPDEGVRTPTVGRYGTDAFSRGALAVDPCTGTMGLAYPQQVSGSANTEMQLVILPPALDATPIGPIRVTTAPGPAASPAIAFARDRFYVFWSDARHDLAPETCDRCLSELYVAAYGLTGTQVTPETRLTTGAASTTVANVVAVAHPTNGEAFVGWTDSASNQVSAGIVGPSGAMRARQTASEVTSPRRANSLRAVWNDGFTLLYRHDEPNGSSPDYLHGRTMLDDGTLLADHDLRVAAEQLAFASRGEAGYVTVTTGGSPLALRLWDPAWTATTTLPVSYGTFDGTRGLGWDGSSLYVTDVTSVVAAVRLNALGTQTGRVVLTSAAFERSATDIVLHVVGSRLVFEWVYTTSAGGSYHRVQVIDRSAFD